MKSEQKTKVNKEKYGENGGENTSHHTESQRIQRQAQPFPWVIIPREHQHTQRNCKSPSTQRIRNRHSTKNHNNMVRSRCTNRGT